MAGNEVSKVFKKTSRRDHKEQKNFSLTNVCTIRVCVAKTDVIFEQLKIKLRINAKHECNWKLLDYVITGNSKNALHFTGLI